MIVETGTVVAVESDSLWVETIQKTACEACVAKKGCGTRVLSKLIGKTNRIRVLQQQSADDLVIGQDVSFAIPEDVIVKSSMLVYIVPIACSVLGAWLAGSTSDLTSILGAISGLLLGGLIVNIQSKKTRNDLRYNPVLFDGSGVKQNLDFL